VKDSPTTKCRTLRSRQICQIHQVGYSSISCGDLPPPRCTMVEAELLCLPIQWPKSGQYQTQTQMTWFHTPKRGDPRASMTSEPRRIVNDTRLRDILESWIGWRVLVFNCIRPYPEPGNAGVYRLCQSIATCRRPSCLQCSGGRFYLWRFELTRIWKRWYDQTQGGARDLNVRQWNILFLLDGKFVEADISPFLVKPHRRHQHENDHVNLESGKGAPHTDSTMEGKRVL
jgi:hypothetical protein